MTITQPTDSKVPTGIRLPETLWKRLRTVAIDLGVSASSIAEEAIVAKLERIERERERRQQKTA